MNRIFIYSCLIFIVCAASYIQFRSLTTPFSGIKIEQNGTSEWNISIVVEDSIASSYHLEPGNRIVSFDGRSTPRLFTISEENLLINTKKIEVQDEDGHQRSIEISPTRNDVLENGFAFLMEVFLIGVGWYSVRKRPESRLFRRFFLMNAMIAMCIVFLFSDEIPLYNYLFPLFAIWLPYVMLSFYLLFGFRSVHAKFRPLLNLYQLYSVVFSLYAIFTLFRNVWFPFWVTDLLNFSLIFTVVLMVGITAFYWTGFDRIEKNQLFILFIGAVVSLMSYVLLYALPFLLWKSSFVPAEYTLVGLVPISGTFTYLLVRRQMLDLRTFIPKLAVRSLYYGLTLCLFFLAATWGNPGYAAGLFILFGIMTYGYRRLLPRWRKDNNKQDWLENQKLHLSLQLTERNHIRNTLRLIADMLHDRIPLHGIVIVYHDGESQPLVHATGIYREKWTHGTPNVPNPDYWFHNEKFPHVKELSGLDSDRIGYLCLGPKRDDTPLTSNELDIAEKLSVEAARLLANAREIIRLQHEHKRQKRRMEPEENRDSRTYNRMLIEAREAEKIRISYFLHDDLLQNLIFLSRDLEELHDTGRYDAERAATWLKCLYDTQRSIRSLSDLLYPHILDKGDLQEALHWLLRDMNHEEEVAVSLHYDAPSPEPFTAYVKANLFRAVRELIVNVFKHAQATELQVRIWMGREFVFCSVTDNGKGFSDASILHKSASGGTHFGLLSVCDQIEQLGGTTDIDSLPGHGTTVTLKLPLFKENLSQ
ncbi:ATP-binding protein [Gorillibacterium massiliense]|uniref:ATP-binding protein n=1 Tax=Gorillibacterium massiliense TaxID=1280390 RepID=UPI0012DC359B|nr:ATP-binding protein [Gorillibacterium massiliense]